MNREVRREGEELQKAASPAPAPPCPQCGCEETMRWRQGKWACLNCGWLGI